MCFVKEPTEFEESAITCTLVEGNTNADFAIITLLNITFGTNNSDNWPSKDALFTKYTHEIKQLLKWLNARLSILKSPDYLYKKLTKAGRDRSK